MDKPALGSPPKPRVLGPESLQKLNKIQRILYKDFKYIDNCNGVKSSPTEDIEHPSEQQLTTSTATVAESHIENDVTNEWRGLWPTEVFYPKHPPPDLIVLPFEKEAAEEFSLKNIEQTRVNLGKQGTQVLTIGKGVTKPPGWLVEIPEEYFAYIRKIRHVVENVKDPLHPFEELEALLDILNTEMHLRITAGEICEILRRIPLTQNSKYSFSHFLFALANPAVAEKKHVIAADAQKNRKCANDDLEYLLQEVIADYDAKNRSGSSLSKDGLETAAGAPRRSMKDYVYLGKITKPPVASGQDKEQDQMQQRVRKPTIQGPNKTYSSGYSPREQFLYSALFFIDMYPLVRRFKEIYKSQTIPVSSFSRKLRDIKSSGLGQEKTRVNNKQLAAWDRIKPVVPKLSPYLANRTLVNTKIIYHQPNPWEPVRHFDRITRQNIHLTIHPPKPDDPNRLILFTENQSRIRRTLRCIGDEGMCVAYLPDLDALISPGLGDILQMEDEIVELAGNFMNYPQKSDASGWIRSESNKLFKLSKSHKYKLDTAKLPSGLLVSEARDLREESEIRNLEEWEALCEKRAEYRRELWKRLDPERVPCGPLRNRFVDAFLTYVPSTVALNPGVEYQSLF